MKTVTEPIKSTLTEEKKREISSLNLGQAVQIWRGSPFGEFKYANNEEFLYFADHLFNRLGWTGHDDFSEAGIKWNPYPELVGNSAETDARSYEYDINDVINSVWDEQKRGSPTAIAQSNEAGASVEKGDTENPTEEG